MTLNLLEMDWGYITGFFDADGSLTLLKKEQRVYPCVTFHNTSLSVLKSIQDHLLSSLDILGYIQMYVPSKDNHEVMFNLKYSYYKSCLPVLTNMDIVHPKKKYRKSVVFQLDTARRLRKPKLYRNLVKEFYQSWDEDATHETDNNNYGSGSTSSFTSSRSRTANAAMAYSSL